MANGGDATIDLDAPPDDPRWGAGCDDYAANDLSFGYGTVYVHVRWLAVIDDTPVTGCSGLTGYTTETGNPTAGDVLCLVTDQDRYARITVTALDRSAADVVAEILTGPDD